MKRVPGCNAVTLILQVKSIPANPMHKVKYLLFDLGNVLFDLDEPATVEAMRSLLREDRFPDDLMNAIRGYDTGQWSTERFINFFLRQAKRDVQARDVVIAWNRMMVGMRPEVFGLLEKLAAQYPLYLLSNINDLHFHWFHRHLREVHGVTDFSEKYFVKTYYSHLIGYRKPDTECFEFVLRDAGISPEDTLFIDDKAENTASAEALGIRVHTLENSYVLESALSSILPDFS